MNKVIISGNLCRPIELHNSGDTSYLRNCLAVRSSFKNKNTGEYDTLFFNFTIFGKCAETLNKYATKGTKVLIEGNLDKNIWEDKNGNKHDDIVLKATNVELLSFKDKNQDSNVDDQYASVEKEDNVVENQYDISEEDLPF